MSTAKQRALDEFDRAVQQACERDSGAYAYALGLVEAKVPASHLLWAAERLNDFRVAE